MWKPPCLDKRLVTITLCPDVVTCSIICQSTSSSPLVLMAYQRFDLTHLELEKLILFNPTALKKYIDLFLLAHNAHHAFVACALRGPSLFEQFVTLPHAHAKRDHFTQTELNSLVWDFQYLYFIDGGLHTYYVAGFAHQLILQYQLLAIRASLNMIALTTQQMGLLHLYKFQRGHSFRSSQLAIDMLQHHNITDYLCTLDTLNRILHIPGHLKIDQHKELRYLLAACGLYIGKEIAT